MTYIFGMIAGAGICLALDGAAHQRYRRVAVGLCICALATSWLLDKQQARCDDLTPAQKIMYCH